MRSVAFAFALLSSVLSAQANEALAIAVDLAEQAISKGHGNMCDLEMKPVRSGGYYHCLDFGPYRYVRGYNKVSGYVIEKGKPPFAIFEGPRDNPDFIYDGPWVSDVTARMVMWWSDNIERTSREYEAKARQKSRAVSAAEYISSLNKPTEPADKEPPLAPANIPSTKTEIIAEDIRTILGQ